MKTIMKTITMLCFVSIVAIINVLLRRLTSFYYPIDLSWIVGTLVIVRFMSNRIDKELLK